MTRTLRLALVALPLLAATTLAADAPWIARGTAGMVASDCPRASQIGADVLTAGGNAFDAAVATSLTLSVTRSFGTGIGGGGFALLYIAAEDRCIALDFRESAPASATPQRYAGLHANRANGPSASIFGGNAVGIPGQLAGLGELHARFGSRPWAELVTPAATLAETGFEADPAYREACQTVLANLAKWPQLRTHHGPFIAMVLPHNRPPELGQRVRRPQLAATLRTIADDGPAAFYRGSIAYAIVRAVNAAGGEIYPADLEAYRVIERTPLRITTDKYDVVTMPPPSSGGVCLAQTLNILGILARDSGGLRPLHDAAQYHPALVNALKHAFADRARWLGDPDFSDIPVARLTSQAYAETLARRTATRPADFGTLPPDDAGTSHFTIVDRHGNIVALTETINDTFGSLVVAQPFGIILNNEMDDFLTVPGQANLFGLQQGRPNLVGPGKRPLSSMTPTIVFQDGRPVLALGASGGPRIITATLQVLLNVMEFNQPLEQAVAATRLHHQWQPDEVYFDADPPADALAALTKAGQTISTKRRSAVVQAVQIRPDGTLIGASDPRKAGRPAAAP
jgi:gamma-glutamyltranspeptidase/glutathione hydrolase